MTKALAITSPMLTTEVPARPCSRMKLATTEPEDDSVSMMKQTALRMEITGFSRVMINFVFLGVRYLVILSIIFMIVLVGFFSSPSGPRPHLPLPKFIDRLTKQLVRRVPEAEK